MGWCATARMSACRAGISLSVFCESMNTLPTPSRALPRLQQLWQGAMVLLLVLAVVVCGLFAWRVYGLWQRAVEAEQRAAPALADQVRAVSNVGQLQVLGEQLLTGATRQSWQAAGTAMQALAFQPSMAALNDPQGVVKQSFEVAAQLMQQRESNAPAAELEPLWRAHWQRLKALADEGVIDMVALSTDMAQATQQAARDLLAMLVIGTVLAVVAVVSLLQLVKRQALDPLTAMARRLAELQAGADHPATLPTPASKEVADVFLGLLEFERARQALQASEERWRFALEGAGDGVWEYHFDTGVNMASARIREMVGLPREDGRHAPLPGWSRRLTPETLAATQVALQAMVQGRCATYRVEQQVRCEDGSHKWLLARGMVISRGPAGEPLRMIGTSSDITARKHAEQKLQLAASVFGHAREGIMITDPQGVIIEVNDTFTRLTGYRHDEALGQTPRLLSSGRQDVDFYAAMWHELTTHGHWSGEIWNRHKSGEVFAVMQTISAVHSAQGELQNYVSLFSDITPMKAHQQQLEYIAHYDVLTSLPNRVLLADRLSHAMRQAQRHQRSLAVAYLDLDGFKAVNDTHGHSAGDELLVTVSQRMKDALREGDTLARMGGDEFVVVLGDLAQPTDCEPVLQRLLAAAAAPVGLSRIHCTDCQVSVSIGVALFPQDDADADLLLRRADQAMYVAKQAGRNRFHVFDVQADTAIKSQREDTDRLQLALVRGEFVLHYQPKVNIVTGEVVGAEALIRWQHPSRGLLAPGLFLPIIENHPLAVDIGEWVIHTALAQMAAWRAAGLNVPVSVNIGARQLQQPDFVSRLEALLARFAQVPRACLELEILETSALHDIAEVSATLHACKAMGVGFALDDFGTGYSSLTYLRHLPVSVLKIDQSFVRDMLVDADDLAIVSGVIGLAANFGREVIAEGVETREHGMQLQAMGCHVVQGYGIARPMPASAWAAWVAQRSPENAWVA
jgi:diguanylate cyclase (GGDEF)-like protein/PAS domain S-box-containing protein